MFDLDEPTPAGVEQELKALEGVFRVRVIR